MADKDTKNNNTTGDGVNPSEYYAVEYGLDGDLTLGDVKPLAATAEEKAKEDAAKSRKIKKVKKKKANGEEEESEEEAPVEEDNSEDEEDNGNGKKKKKKAAPKKPAPKIRWQSDLDLIGSVKNRFGGAKSSVIVAPEVNTKTITIMDIKGKNGKTAHVTRVPFKASPESPEFFDYLAGAISEYLGGKPASKDTVCYLVLSDRCAALDIITIPAINKKRVQESLEINISETYKDITALMMSCSTVASNKKMVTYTLTSIRKKLLENYKRSFMRVKMPPKVYTFAGSSTLNSVFALQSRTKGRSFIFMDIKKDFTRFVVCARGRLVGFFDHPIGYSILDPEKIVNESVLYDHDVAEVAVLNAEEKAKRKELTLLESDAAESEDSGEASFLDQVIGGNTEAAEAPTQQADNKKAPKVHVKKVARKLPKFMLRPEPETPEGRIAENFRIFEKWALLLARENKGLGKGCDPEYILVNIPPQFSFVIDEANKEKKENGLEFRRLATEKIPPKVAANLELFGAVYSDTYNLQQNF